jgi:hypothetical protein
LFEQLLPKPFKETKGIGLTTPATHARIVAPELGDLT